MYSLVDSSHFSINSAKRTDCSASSTSSKFLINKVRSGERWDSNSFFDVGETLSPLVKKTKQRDKRIKVKKNSKLELITPFKDYFETIKKERFRNAITVKNLTQKERIQREGIINWMLNIGYKMNLMQTTIHKAATYFTRIIESNLLEESELEDVGMVCFLIAGKYLETPQEIESLIYTFREQIGSTDNIDVTKYEIQIMNLLHWDLHCVTPLDFLNIFKSQGIFFCSDHVSSLMTDNTCSTESLSKRLDYLLEYVTNACLKEYEFIVMDPLIVAAGILAIARNLMGLMIMWNESLELLTTVTVNEVEECVCLITKYCGEFNIQTEDELDEGSRIFVLPRSSDISTMNEVNNKHPVMSKE